MGYRDCVVLEDATASGEETHLYQEELGIRPG
jgi:hypothetical protein